MRICISSVISIRLMRGERESRPSSLSFVRMRISAATRVSVGSPSRVPFAAFEMLMPSAIKSVPALSAASLSTVPFSSMIARYSFCGPHRTHAASARFVTAMRTVDGKEYCTVASRYGSDSIAFSAFTVLWNSIERPRFNLLSVTISCSVYPSGTSATRTVVSRVTNQTMASSSATASTPNSAVDRLRLRCFCFSAFFSARCRASSFARILARSSARARASSYSRFASVSCSTTVVVAFGAFLRLP